MRTPGRARLLTAGALLALALLVAGAVVAYLGYRTVSGPDGAVRGYLGALQRGDAPAALAFGDVPAGPRTLLTTQALAEQDRVAPIRRVLVTTAWTRGARAGVDVRYVLDFPGHPQPVRTQVAVHRRDGEWRLDRVAVSTQLTVRRAAQRVTVLGRVLPDDPVLVFPGAAPVGLDTPYLRLAAASGGIALDAQPSTQLDVEVTPTGRRLVGSAVDRALLACVSGRGPLTCPLPDGRYVPGSVRGSLAAPHPSLTVDVGPSNTGTIEVTGSVTVIGTYRELTFDNRVRSGQGHLRLPVHATAFATSPQRVAWARVEDAS